jgi:hypothetical protein
MSKAPGLIFSTTKIIIIVIIIITKLLTLTNNTWGLVHLSPLLPSENGRPELLKCSGREEFTPYQHIPHKTMVVLPHRLPHCSLCLCCSLLQGRSCPVFPVLAPTSPWDLISLACLPLNISFPDSTTWSTLALLQCCTSTGYIIHHTMDHKEHDCKFIYIGIKSRIPRCLLNLQKQTSPS